MLGALVADDSVVTIFQESESSSERVVSFEKSGAFETPYFVFVRYHVSLMERCLFIFLLAFTVHGCPSFWIGFSPPPMVFRVCFSIDEAWRPCA
jgi:hypothetical protein